MLFLEVIHPSHLFIYKFSLNLITQLISPLFWFSFMIFVSPDHAPMSCPLETKFLDSESPAMSLTGAQSVSIAKTPDADEETDDLPNQISADYEVPQFPIEQIEKKLMLQRHLTAKWVLLTVQFMCKAWLMRRIANRKLFSAKKVSRKVSHSRIVDSSSAHRWVPFSNELQVICVVFLVQLSR